MAVVFANLGSLLCGLRVSLVDAVQYLLSRRVGVSVRVPKDVRFVSDLENRERCGRFRALHK
jgi:hypothetical protein